MSRLVGKPTICIGENKDADQLRGNRVFVFATQIVQFLFYLNPKFQASSSFLCLYSPVCVGPVRKPHCWFSHEVAQMVMMVYKVLSVLAHVKIDTSSRDNSGWAMAKNALQISKCLLYLARMGHFYNVRRFQMRFFPEMTPSIF